MSVLLRLVRSLVVFVASLTVASLVTFTLCAVLPGDPARILLGLQATPDAVARLRHQLGTDRPFVVRYLDWVSGLPAGDFGTSYVSHVSVGGQIAARLGVTLSLVVAGTLLALVVAVPVGTLAAVGHRRASGTVISALTQIGMAVPAFWAGILLVFVFAVKLRWLPANGYEPLGENPLQWLRHLVLPAVSLALVQGAVLSRYVRSAVLEVMREDFIRTARAVGRTRMSALLTHGLRNASVPVLTVLGLQLTTLLVGAIVVESVFALPGLGRMLLQAVASRDLLLVQGTVMVLVFFVLLVNLLVDVTYLAVDPRLRSAR